MDLFVLMVMCCGEGDRMACGSINRRRPGLKDLVHFKIPGRVESGSVWWDLCLLPSDFSVLWLVG